MRGAEGLQMALTLCSKLAFFGCVFGVGRIQPFCLQYFLLFVYHPRAEILDVDGHRTSSGLWTRIPKLECRPRHVVGCWRVRGIDAVGVHPFFLQSQFCGVHFSQWRLESLKVAKSHVALSFQKHREDKPKPCCALSILGIWCTGV